MTCYLGQSLNHYKHMSAYSCSHQCFHIGMTSAMNTSFDSEDYMDTIMTSTMIKMMMIKTLWRISIP